MATIPKPSSLNSSRLIRYLHDLSVTDAEVTHGQFAERLSRLIDFSDSIILSAAHGELPNLEFTPANNPENTIQEGFLEARSAMVENITKSTTPESGYNRIKLPTPRPGESIDKILSFESYYRFYVLHQREMELKIQCVRVNIREGFTELSTTLAKLAILDRALGDTLLPHTRRFFSTIPRLLEKRFNHLYEQHHQAMDNNVEDDPLEWMASDRWLGQFYKEIQGLLLAELEVRLQPLIGLLEALNTENGRKS